jgi:protein phosphatase
VDLADEAACADAALLVGDPDGRRWGRHGGQAARLRHPVRGKKGLIQPALKVRGREYLRIIYGPEYDAPETISYDLRERGLAGKRNLALREFALGHEGLKRFVAREPLRRVHECVFAVLALGERADRSEALRSPSQIRRRSGARWSEKAGARLRASDRHAGVGPTTDHIRHR